jgi:hypothetical protein
MKTVVAAMDCGLAARPVLATARALAELFDAEAEALHVRSGAAEPPHGLAEAAGVPLRIIDGDVVARIAAASDADEVVALVLGSRGLPNDPRPLGTTAEAVATTVVKPVVVVPPDAALKAQLRRVLVPLEGVVTTARAPRSLIELGPGADLEIVVLHVVAADDIPLFTDQPQHEQDAWAREFLARYLPRGFDVISFETRVGDPETLVPRVAAETRCDLVALGWSQDFTGGRAGVVRATLAHAPIPVVLVPVQAVAGAREPATVGGRAEWAAES